MANQGASSPTGGDLRRKYATTHSAGCIRVDSCSGPPFRFRTGYRRRIPITDKQHSWHCEEVHSRRLYNPAERPMEIKKLVTKLDAKRMGKMRPNFPFWPFSRCVCTWIRNGWNKWNISYVDKWVGFPSIERPDRMSYANRRRWNGPRCTGNEPLCWSWNCWGRGLGTSRWIRDRCRQVVGTRRLFGRRKNRHSIRCIRCHKQSGR